MSAEIETTLRAIDAWYNEPHGDNNRPSYLSKFATLELCGWLETRIDEMMEKVGEQYGLEVTWVKSNVTKRISGFTYPDHIRKMLVSIVGEVGLRKVESALEGEFPGALQFLTSELAILTKARNHFAHTDSAVPLPQQVSLDGPSVSINRYQVLAPAIDKFQAKLFATL